MIGSVFIKCNAASPNIPLKPLYTFKGSPSSLRVIDVPRKIGSWQITAVRVSATYPDNRAVTASAVLVGGAWVATLDAPDATGQVCGGLVVTADGTDEQGNAVTGYVLGVGDLHVLDRDLSISVGGEVYYLHFFDEQPDAPHKGDMTVIGGALKWWNGEAWELFGAGGDVSHSEFAGLPAEDLVADEVGFPEICEMINKMKNILRPAALVAATCLAAFGATAAPSVEKSKLSALKGGSNVVTAVSFDGLATDAALGDEVTRAKAAEKANADAIAAETTRAKSAETAATDYTTAVSNKLEAAVATKADASALSSLAPLSSLTSHTNDTSNPHAVTASQVGAYSKSEIDAKGYLTSYTETDPTFSAWRGGASIVAGHGASANSSGAVAIGYNANASESDSVALGSESAAKDYSSTAVGYHNTARGESSTAVGYGNTAIVYCSSALGSDNTASGSYSSALGYNNTASGKNSTAIGYQAFTSNKWENALAFSQTPDLIYLGSSTTNSGATARTLQSYLDERAPRYTFAAPTDTAIAAADGTMYSVSADTDGVSVTLPAAASYAQDFVVRLAPADTNGTCLAEVKAGDGTAWQFDYPTGTNAVFGTITAPTYFTFTQTAADRWSVFTYAATKEE